MTRTNFLGPLSALVLAGIIPLAAACNGHVSLGDTGNTLKSVSPISAQASVVPASPVTCASGWAHPNVCCEASASTPTTCGEWEDNPFQKCEPGWTTYPNQTSCCDLSNAANCVSTSASAGSASSGTGSSPSSGGSSPGTGTTTPASPPPSYGCGFACLPGWWAQAIASTADGPTVPGCCTLDSNGALACSLQGGDDSVSTTPACAGPVPTTEDAGIGDNAEDSGSEEDAGATLVGGGWDGCEDAGSSYWPGYDGGATSLCSACPAGWSANDPLQPELCCKGLSDGTTLCFSQATGWASGSNSSGPSSGGSASNGGTVSPPVVTEDAGVSGSNPSGGASWASSGAAAPDGGVSGPSCTGSSSSCSCDETVNGHTYALDCYLNASAAVTCTCTVDGTATSAQPSVDSCEDENGVGSAFSSGCGFP